MIGNAISRGNPELEAVLDRKIRHVSLPEAIREHFLWEARSVVIAGTHGKTTTTSLAGWLLTHGGVDPTVFVGGIARNFGSERIELSRRPPGAPFVIEGDEYDSAFFDKTAKFLKYLPDIAVINNIEFDHADIYTISMRCGWRFDGSSTWCRGAACAARRGQRGRRGARAAGAKPRADLRHCARASTGAQARSRASPAARQFRVWERGVDRGAFTVPLVGAHNVRNALAAIAVGSRVRRRSSTRCVQGSRQFAGVKRRLESSARKRDIAVYDDFAHHPTAVAETLAAVRAAQPQRRIWAVFEPRSASSCRRVFQDDFARAFRTRRRSGRSRRCFARRCPQSERLSEDQLVEDLRRAGVSARHLPDVDTIVAAGRGRSARRRPHRHHVEWRIRRHSRQAARGACDADSARRATRCCWWSWSSVIDPAINDASSSLPARLRARLGRVVRDVVPAYCSIGIHFDPLLTDLAALERVD